MKSTSIHPIEAIEMYSAYVSNLLIMMDFLQAADKEVAMTGHIKSEGDLFITGTQAGLTPVGVEHSMFHPSQHYQAYTVGPPTDDLKHVLQHCTGWQSVPRPADQTGVA